MNTPLAVHCLATALILGLNSSAVSANNPLVFGLPKFSQPPVLDGIRDPDEWAGALELECSPSQVLRDAAQFGWRAMESQQSEISANQLVQSATESAREARTDADYSARIWQGWDDEAFYYLAEVRDNFRDVQGAGTPTNWWERDSMTLYVDLANSREEWDSSKGYVYERARLNQINFVAAPMSSSSVTITWERPIPDNRNPTQDPGDIAGMEYGYRSAGGEFGGNADYVIEGKIPWSTLLKHNLPAVPTVGTALGFMWVSLDPDGDEGYGGQLQCWGLQDNPADYSTWVLSDESVGPSIGVAPKMRLSSSSLSFAGTQPGTSQQTVTIANTGTADLVISGMSTQGPDAARFQVSPSTATVPAGGSQTITVTFTQGMAGTKSATLSILHNGSGSPATIALSGPGPTLKLSVGSATGLRRGTVTVPVSVANAQGLAGGDLTLSYDVNALNPKQVTATDLLTKGGVTVVPNLAVKGQVKVSMAGAAGLASGSGPLIQVTFEVWSSARIGVTPLTLQAKVVDESGKAFTSTTEAGAVTVVLLGDVSGDQEVGAGDAVLVLRHSAGLANLSDAQKDIGDVNADKSLNSADAILILRYSAGIITKFPREGVTKLAAAGTPGAGIRLGDVRGTTASAEQPQEFTVPLVLGPGVGGGDLVLRYDGLLFRLVGVDGPEGSLVATNAGRSGQVRLSVARSEALGVATMRVLLEGVPANLAIELSGEAFGIDGNLLTVVDSHIAQPQVCSLSGYPNPFNPATTLRYELAEDGPVQLVIYDVSGAMVRRLVSGWQTTGGYAVPWDGRDEAGQPVASGLYLGCLETARLRQVHKLMLLK